jgi:lactate permease
MTWMQNYDPLGSAVWSTVMAVAPAALLLVGMTVFRWRIHTSAFVGLGAALAVAVAGYRMPFEIAVGAAVYGALFGAFPIGWIILNVIFLYQLTVERGLF